MTTENDTTTRYFNPKIVSKLVALDYHDACMTVIMVVEGVEPRLINGRTTPYADKASWSHVDLLESLAGWQKGCPRFPTLSEIARYSKLRDPDFHYNGHKFPNTVFLIME